MAFFTDQNVLKLKLSQKSGFFNKFLSEIVKLFKTKTDMRTEYVQAGSSKLIPVYLTKALPGNRYGQQRNSRQLY
jgi:hypothetical protein